MKICDLKKLRTLTATTAMMRIAEQDKPKKVVEKTSWGSEYVREMVKYGLFLRCQVLDGILKTAIFLPDTMRLGARLPAYEVFIDKESGAFLTYDRQRQKWLTAKLDRLDWPRAIYNSEDRWIDPKGYALVKRYLNTKEGGYEGILEYQLSTRERQLAERHRKETAPWDDDLAQTPALPKDWTHWVDKVGIPDNYIFYRYTRKGAGSGYCTFCGKEVPIVKPRHNKPGRCRCCRHEIVFKAIGKAGRVDTSDATMYLLQRCRDSLMIREFHGCRHYEKGRYTQPTVSSYETRRAIFDVHAKPLRTYYWGDYKHREIRWIGTQNCDPLWGGVTEGRCYGKTLPALAARELRCTGLPETLRAQGMLDPEQYLAALHVVPQLEQLAKANLSRLVRECIHSPGTFSTLFAKAGSLTKQLRLDAQGMKRLRENDGGYVYLQWLQQEKESGRPLPDDTIRWLCHEGIRVDDLNFISDRMSAVQAENYVQRQMEEFGSGAKQVLSLWSDYLSMAERLGMDTGDAIVYRVRRLRQRHDELVEECRKKELALRAVEVQREYPRLEDILGTLRELYAYNDKTYTVIAPTCAMDILQEGHTLHHCVGSSHLYWERIERRESYILFLRHAAEPEKPFYTLEVEPDGAVRQRHTEYNRQDVETEAVIAFLREWQKAVRQRLAAHTCSFAAMNVMESRENAAALPAAA